MIKACGQQLAQDDAAGPVRAASLHDFAREDAPDVLREMLALQPALRKLVNEADENGWTPLMYAIANASKKAVEVLLRFGAIIDRRQLATISRNHSIAKNIARLIRPVTKK